MTPIGFVAINDGTYGGVYYTPAFTTSGAITWTYLTTTGLASKAVIDFKVDPFNPRDRQYVIAGNVLYTRNAGNWSNIMDLTAAQTLTGAANLGANRSLSNAWADPTVEGSIYCIYYTNSGISQSVFILKSLNYGASWTVQWAPPSIGGGPSQMQVYGNTIWITHNDNYPPRPVVFYTTNGGSTRSQTNNVLLAGFQVNYPWDLTQAYGQPTAAIGTSDLYKWDYGDSPEYTLLQAGSIADGMNDVGAGHVMWVSPVTQNHQRIARGTTLLYTTDGWSTYSTTTLTGIGGTFIKPFHATHIQNTGTDTEVIIGISASSSGAYRSSVYALDSETDTTATLRNGANSETTYVDSVPSNLLLASRTPIWVGNQPVSTGIFVYADEQESDDNAWAADISDYDKLGSPMGGDRAAFRDMDVDGLAVYHAQDIHAGTPQRHNPWPASSGQAPVSDGAKYVATDIATQAELDTHSGTPAAHHDPVTLAADADTILGLSTQQITLDSQSANRVLAGPTSGAAADPAFRALVPADLPIDNSSIISNGTTIGTSFTGHEHVYQEDLSARCDGSQLVFYTANAYETETTMIWLNGVLQKPVTQYTEDTTSYDSLTFSSAPVAGDELIIAYVMAMA